VTGLDNLPAQAIFWGAKRGMMMKKKPVPRFACLAAPRPGRPFYFSACLLLHFDGRWRIMQVSTVGFTYKLCTSHSPKGLVTPLRPSPARAQEALHAPSALSTICRPLVHPPTRAVLSGVGAPSPEEGLVEEPCYHGGVADGVAIDASGGAGGGVAQKPGGESDGRPHLQGDAGR